MDPHPSWQSVPPVKVALWFVCIGLGIWFLANIVHTMTIFLLAMGLTWSLAPLATRLTEARLPSGRRLSWNASVVVVYFGLTLLLVTSMLAAVPVVVMQARTLAQSLPQEMPRLQTVVDDWQFRFQHWKLPPAAKANIEQGMHSAVEKVGDSLVRMFELTATGVINTFSGLVIVLAAYIIGFFFLLGYPEMRSRFFAHIPEPYRSDVRSLAAEMNHIFGGFVRGTGILALCVGSVNYIMLSCIGVLGWMGAADLPPFQYTMLVSVLSAVGYLVPIAGLIVTSLLAGLLAWFQVPSVYYVVVVVGTLVVATNLTDRMLQPKILGGAIGVSPMFVVFAACAGAEMFGFWGMILGVPGAAMTKTLWLYVYRRFLHEETPQSDPLMVEDKPDVEPLEEASMPLMALSSSDPADPT
ncbi:MAG TPA: AI-2E family transporter [Candidatus Xenobia bacterium]